MKDVGFGMTVQDKNAPDLVPLYRLSDEMGMEFATATLHNSFYFVEAKNIIHDRPMVAKNFEASSTSCCGAIRPKSGSAPTSTMASSTTSTARSACCPVI